MSDESIQRELGEINTKLNFLINAQKEAAESRAETNQRLQRGELRMQKIESEASNVRRDIEEFRPLVITVRRWEQRGIGAAAVIAAMGAIFGATLVALREKLFSLLGGGG